jgi:type I restriction enzyme, S subunit
MIKKNILQFKKLGEIAKINYGYTEKSSFKKIGPKFLRITDIQDNNVNWEIVPSCKIENNDIPKYQLSDGDIVFARTGATTGKSFLIKSPPQAIFASYLIRLHILDSSKLMPEFLFHFFQTNTYWDNIKKGLSGSAQGGFNASKLSEIMIPLPPLSEQQHIVTILDKAFTAIDKAKSNAEQNLKNSKKLFESYLQSIKAEKKPLGNLVDIKTGKLDSNAAVEGGKYPFFTCSREIFAINNYAFDLEAILLAGNNASGDFNVKYFKGKFNAYQRTYIITVTEERKVLYRYLYFQLLNSLKEFKEKSVGSNTRFLKLAMIQNMKIPLPSIKEQQAIVQKLDALSAETKKLETIYQAKINDLEQLKKSLLQKAFSGELGDNIDVNTNTKVHI